MKTQTQFKNASLVSVVNGSIVVKDSTEREYIFTNASVVSVNNGTIIIETEWKPKKGELIKVIGGGIDCYVIFNSKTGCVLNTFGNKEISGNWYYLKSHIWACNDNVKFYPVTPEEQKEFDDFCKSQGKIWNKETLQWEKYRWEPKRGEKYYYIDITGKVLRTTYNTFTVDPATIEFGNYFQTEEQAQEVAKKLKGFFKSL